MKATTDMGSVMRNVFILFAIVFALVTTATATVVGTAVSSDAAMALATLEASVSGRKIFW
jgi:hypothetical protein